MRPKVLIVALATTLTLALAAGPASAHVPTPVGKQGCTPGFWKNNLLPWESTAPNVYSPSTKLGSVFANVPANLREATFLQALGFPGTAGPAARLLRAGVAGLLSTVHFDVAYPIGVETQLINRVSAALAGTAAQQEALKNELDRYNNLGCPLSANRDY